MASIRQTNFSAGELDPLLWGRTDLAKFNQGLRRCRDFFISRHGAAVSRPGTTYVASTKLSVASAVRLIPFVYSDTQTYVLEFGHHYIRFYSDGAVVESAPSTPLEVVTTYDEADLDSLQWAQSGDVLTITHPNYAPAELTRTSHTSWALAAIDFTRPVAFEAVTDVYLKAPLPTEDSANGLTSREWSWAVSAIIRNDVHGYVTETAATILTKTSTAAPWPGTALADIPQRVCAYPSRPVTLWIPQDAYLAIGDHTIIGYRIYRGRGGLHGWIGDIGGGGGPLPGSVDLTFTDVGQEPDYAMAPPRGRVPFAGAGDYPAATTYFQDRLGFGGTDLRREQVFLSATGDYHNFDERLVPVADEALNYGFVSRKREDIRAMLGLDQLVIGTGGSIWTFDPGGDAAAPDVVSRFRVQVEVGMKRLPFLVIGQTVLFARNKGNGVHSLVPGGQNGWQSGDLSSVASHFFAGTDYDIVDWAYAEDPWGLVWVVRADGALLSLTYSQADEMWAWAQHSTDGLVRNVCSVPEGNEDAVYLVVERDNPAAAASTAEQVAATAAYDDGIDYQTGDRVTHEGVTYSATSAILGGTPDITAEWVPITILYLERMASRVRYGTTDDDVCVDSALEYSGAPTLTLTGLDHLEGKEVYVIGKDNPVRGPYTVASGDVTLDELPTANDGSSVSLWAGLLYQPELETLDVASGEARLKQKRVISVGFEVDQSRGVSVGQDFDHLTEWEQRQVSDGYATISAATELVQVAVPGSWNQSARAVLRQTQPLPVTVVGLVREVASGE